MKRLLKDIFRELGAILVPPKKPKYVKPKLCQCKTCGQIHYRAIWEG